MTQEEFRATDPKSAKWSNGSLDQAGMLEIAQPASNRTRAASEVGSAIVHQLNGPLTALRLYLGEIRQHSRQFIGIGAVDDSLMQIVENAFQDIERVCAMTRLMADTFEAPPLQQEAAVVLGREVINWWTRSGSTESHGRADGCGPAESASSQPLHELLTPREREVLGYVRQGCSNKQGAIKMKIAPRTFESHRAQVMRKLGARNGADLVRIARGEDSGTL
jgi:DNA-binding NarL/FixJ family response regulator